MNGQKTYYSFNDIPFDRKENYKSLEPGFFKFSQTEIVEILIAMIVLTVSFSFAITPNRLSNLVAVFNNLPLSFLAIATAFVCTFTIQKSQHGCKRWALYLLIRID